MERWEAAASGGTEPPRAEEGGGSLAQTGGAPHHHLPTQFLDGHLIHTRFEDTPELESILLGLSLFLYQMGLT